MEIRRRKKNVGSFSQWFHHLRWRFCTKLRSRGSTVTAFRWAVTNIESWKRFEMNISLLSCNASTATFDMRIPLFWFWTISRTNRENGARGIRKLVLSWSNFISSYAFMYFFGVDCFRARFCIKNIIFFCHNPFDVLYENECPFGKMSK